MGLIDYTLGQTSIILRVKIRSSSTGNGLTGLTGSSSGLIIGTIGDVEATTTSYTAAGSTIQTIATLGTYAAPSASDCRFSQVDATNHPGVYEIQLANARFAVSNAKSLLVSITGVSGQLDCDVVIPLQGVNPYDGVHGGFSCLPNTSVTTNGSLITSGSSTDQFSVSAGVGKANVVQFLGSTSQGAAGYAGVDWHAITNTSASNSFSGSTVGTATNVTNANVTAIAGVTTAVSGGGNVTFPGGSTISTLTTSAIWQDTNTGDFATVGSIGKGLFTSGNAPGAASGLAIVGSNMGAVSSVTGSVGSISGITFPTHFSVLAIDSSGDVTFNNTTLATVTNLTNAPTTGDFTAAMKTSLNAATPASIQSVTNIVSSGAIITSSGAVVTVTNLTNAPGSGWQGR